MSGPVVIIVIQPPPPPPPPSGDDGHSREIPAVARPTISDQLRDLADVLDGKEPV